MILLWAKYVEILLRTFVLKIRRDSRYTLYKQCWITESIRLAQMTNHIGLVKTLTTRAYVLIWGQNSRKTYSSVAGEVRYSPLNLSQRSPPFFSLFSNKWYILCPTAPTKIKRVKKMKLICSWLNSLMQR